jgi:hypothetical protein
MAVSRELYRARGVLWERGRRRNGHVELMANVHGVLEVTTMTTLAKTRKPYDIVCTSAPTPVCLRLHAPVTHLPTRPSPPVAPSPTRNP